MNMIQGDVGSFISTTNSKSQNKKKVSNFDKYDKRKVKKTEYMIFIFFFNNQRLFVWIMNNHARK